LKGKCSRRHIRGGIPWERQGFGVWEKGEERIANRRIDKEAKEDERARFSSCKST